MSQNAQLAELLQWYADVGADEATGDEPIDRTKLLPLPVMATVLPLAAAPLAATASASPAAPAVTGSIEAVKEATTRAAAAKTIDELRAAIDSFPGLALKRTATQMVFADGNPAARVLIIGDAPGTEEDRAGIPFVGENGQMLTKMLAAIGLKRNENVYLTTIINWRPPGNRAPEAGEIALSLPFIQRHIELLNPAAIMIIGGAPAKILLETKEQVMRLRGKWLEYAAGDLKIPAIVMLHPEYLTRNPAQKKVAWEDLQMFQEKLKELGVL